MWIGISTGNLILVKIILLYLAIFVLKQLRDLPYNGYVNRYLIMTSNRLDL